MNTDVTSNGSTKDGGDRQDKAKRLDIESLKDWMGKEVVLAMPRWGLVSVGFVFLVLLLVALD